MSAYTSPRIRLLTLLMCRRVLILFVTNLSRTSCTSRSCFRTSNLLNISLCLPYFFFFKKKKIIQANKTLFFFFFCKPGFVSKKHKKLIWDRLDIVFLVKQVSSESTV
ncbi:hypothetical protein BDF21DRAFT_212622 [Thamnidium elegans]|nr:hypothetical protein BDF21DRAFT_212622 [Thamnidium elegans]